MAATNELAAADDRTITFRLKRRFVLLLQTPIGRYRQPAMQASAWFTWR